MAQRCPKQFKMNYLITADAQLTCAIFKLRLFLELGIVNETKIFQCQATAKEAGRMLGGWLKSLQSS